MEAAALIEDGFESHCCYGEHDEIKPVQEAKTIVSHVYDRHENVSCVYLKLP